MDEVKLLPCEELLRDWQTERSEWHGPVTLEVVREYAEWREARPPIVTDEVVERLVAAIEAIKSPYDHHRQTGEDCAFGDALEAAEQAVRKAISAMPTIDQDGGEV